MTGRCSGLALAAAVLLVAGCGPRPTRVAPVSGGERSGRYLANLLKREQRAAMVEGAATVWPRAIAPCDTCAARRLPALQAGIALAWPDTFRLRVRSAFGTALDLGLAGDSITAWVPAQRWGAAFDAVRDSLGLDHPANLVARLVSGAWRPPEAAWGRGTEADGLLVLRWSEAADSVALAVDENGLPAWARLSRGDRGVLVRYERWETQEGVAWPVLFEVQGLGGALDLTCRLDRVGFPARSDRGWLAVHIPDGADRLDLDRLRDLLKRLASLR